MGFAPPPFLVFRLLKKKHIFVCLPLPRRAVLLLYRPFWYSFEIKCTLALCDCIAVMTAEISCNRDLQKMLDFYPAYYIFARVEPNPNTEQWIVISYHYLFRNYKLMHNLCQVLYSLIDWLIDWSILPSLHNSSVGAASQCYWEELMLLKFELMLLKCQINTNTTKNGFMLPTKCLEGVLKNSY